MAATIMSSNASVVSYKTKAVADNIAAQFEGDEDFSAKVVERRDGRFVVMVTNIETGEELPL